jgi:mRNA interferase RelE/StbE
LIKVEWTEKAIADLENLDRLVAGRILRKVSWFANNFERAAIEHLAVEFKGMFKLRVGYWRVLYTV